MEADFAAYSPDGLLIVAVEAKARLGFEDVDALDVLRDYQAGRTLRRARFFCVITPEHGFLWRMNGGVQEQYWKFPTTGLLTPYLPSERLVPPLEFELAVGQLMRDLSSGVVTIAIPGQLIQSGMLDAIRGARVRSQRAA